ncbi:autotransporter outer membrane beta-barrel domain-containing protein [Portibacter marinus]|uniref:hypothetical protein n=1 Tax=Portibacter marinus TaxID=2898660 RepID=UPI001F20F9C4|nr:hypothetical protein [Portibacter marinus]
MKNIIRTLVILLLTTITIYGQKGPKGMNYQAVVRSLDGQVMAQKNIDLKITLYSGQARTAVYTEEHHLSSNRLGQISLVIGEGASRSGTLERVPWANDDIWMSVEFKTNTMKGYAALSDTKLLAVPYAYHAVTAEQLTRKYRSQDDGVPSNTWSLFGNSNVNDQKDRLGTTDMADLVLITNNVERMRILESGDISIENNLGIGADLDIANDLNVGNNLDVGQNVNLNTSGGSTTVNGDLDVANMSSTVLTGTLNVQKNSDLDADLNVDGNSTLVGTLNVNGDTDLDSDLNVDGNSTLVGSLNTQGDTDLDGMLNVDGATELNSNLTVTGMSSTLLTGTLNVNKNTTIDEDLTVGGTTSFNGDLDVGGASTLNSLTVEGDSELQGTLDVDGASTLKSTLNVMGNTVLDSDLNVMGNTGLAADLVVDGASTLNSNLTVAGMSTTTLTGDLNVNKNSNLDGTLNVDGATTLGGSLDVDGDATFNSDLETSGEIAAASAKFEGPAIYTISNKKFVAHINNTDDSDDGTNGLAIQIGTTSDFHNSGENDYVSFFNGNGTLTGAIEGFELGTDDPLSTYNDVFPFSFKDFFSLGSFTGSFFSPADLPDNVLSFSEGSLSFDFPFIGDGDVNFVKPNLAKNFSNFVGGSFNPIELLTDFAPLSPSGEDKLKELICWALGNGLESLITTNPFDLALAATIIQATQECKEGSEGGVTYVSFGADYAEWLPRADINEGMKNGMIVGVTNGKISRQTEGADQILAISTNPIVLGNKPIPGKEAEYEKIAFMGQVPVLTRGKVEIGDYILPSGRNDGFGRAVKPEDLQISDLTQIVGRAWSASQNEWMGYVNVAIGLNRNDVAKIVAKQQEDLLALKDEISDLKQGLQSQISDLSAKIDKNRRPIEIAE